MKKAYIILISAIFLCVGMSISYAQVFMSPRGLSLSQTYATQSRNADAIGWNPANLGFEDNAGFSLSFGVFPLVPVPALQLSNNALSAGWYNTYFTQGGYLNNSQKTKLLSVYPETGWNLSPSLQVRLLGISFGHSAIAIDVDVAGEFVIPKAIPQFIFNGNKLNESMDIGNLHSEFQTVATVNIARSFPLRLLPNTYLGIGVKGIIGGGYFRTESMEGGITSYSDRIEANADILGRYAVGGYGYAFDLGLASQLTDRITASASVNNLMGSIKWLDHMSKTHHYTLNFTLESQEITDVDFDSLMNEAVVLDTSYASEPFTTPYPAYYIFGMQFDFTKALNIYINYRQGFTDRLDVSTAPRVSAAAQLSLLKWLPLRFGVLTGGKENFRWGGGFGFEFSHYSMLFGFSQTGGFYNNSTGFAFSFGQELRF